MAGFTLFPAVDLRSGRCVRLEQGAAERESVYNSDPFAVVEQFRASGAEWVHVVDLDAAFGEGSNRPLIGELAHRVPVAIQSGGGVRTPDDIEEMLEAGIARVVLGTVAVEQPEVVPQAVRHWGANRIAVGIDARGRQVATRGWRAQSSVDLIALGSRLVDAGVRTLIYTDIERDGMFSGPNLELAAELAQTTGAEVIVSGGVRDIADLVAAAESGAVGAIVGKALYEGRIELADALARTRPVETS